MPRPGGNGHRRGGIAHRLIGAALPIFAPRLADGPGDVAASLLEIDQGAAGCLQKAQGDEAAEELLVGILVAHRHPAWSASASALACRPRPGHRAPAFIPSTSAGYGRGPGRGRDAQQHGVGFRVLVGRATPATSRRAGPDRSCLPGPRTAAGAGPGHRPARCGRADCRAAGIHPRHLAPRARMSPRQSSASSRARSLSGVRYAVSWARCRARWIDRSCLRSSPGGSGPRPWCCRRSPPSLRPAGRDRRRRRGSAAEPSEDCVEDMSGVMAASPRA